VCWLLIRSLLLQCVFQTDADRKQEEIKEAIEEEDERNHQEAEEEENDDDRNDRCDSDDSDRSGLSGGDDFIGRTALYKKYPRPERCQFCEMVDTVSSAEMLCYPKDSTLGLVCSFCVSSLLALLQDFPARPPLHHAVSALDEVVYR